MANWKPNNGVQGLSVAVRGDSDRDFDHALRKFKRMVKESGIIEEIRDRQYYESKGSKRREARKAAKRRHKRDIAREDALRNRKF